MDHRNENFNMFDLIAYRIKFTPHPHAGSAWWGVLDPPLAAPTFARHPSWIVCLCKS